VNGLLGLVADFLERVANPSHGPEVNDLYGSRLQWLLAEDDGLNEDLGRLELQRDDLPTLTMDAWLWYMRWRCERHPLPSAEFLDALFEATDEPAVHVRIVELVVRHPHTAERLGAFVEAPQPPIEELPVPWLRDRLLRSIGHAEHRHGHATGEPRAMVTYLLQLGDPVCLGVLRSFLAQPGTRELQLGAYVTSLLTDALDEETLGAFLERLGLEKL
jgi:hypothetical protein